MLYLEDYLEMIENVPMEMRDRFTEMREMDLQVQNAMDSLDDQVKNFFKKCMAGQIKQEGKDETYDSIKQGYSKALEDADEKVQLANQIYDLVERYLRKLDQEVAKFKMELEADSAGITEILERRSLELDNPPPTHNNHKAEKRKHASVLGNHLDKRTSTEKVLTSLATEAAREAISAHRTTPVVGGTLAPSSSMYNPAAAAPQISYNLARVGGVGSNPAIQAAASRAIGATLEMSQGRRTSSLKASYDALTRATDVAKDLTFPVEAARATAAAGTPPPSSEKSVSRNKKSGSRAQQQAAAIQPPVPIAPPPVEEVPLPAEYTEMVVDDTTQGSTWSYDPNEPRYCICNDVSYGEMVGCDNEDCPIEWFHYGCVGLAQAPKGKWYCPQCTAAMRRRGRK